MFSYNRNMPIVFIGGIAGSGLELVRVLLNQEATKIRCGTETELLTTIIEKKFDWTQSEKEKERLKYAGMSDDLIDSAVAQFLLQVLLKHEKLTPNICNKDIYIFKWSKYLKRLFPNSKFLLVVRDPRATVSSLIKRKFHYQDIHLGSYKQALVDWDKVATTYYENCKEMEPKSCKLVYYEQLILNTNKTLNEIFKFLNIEFTAHDFGFTDHKNGYDTLLNKVHIKRDNLFSWISDFPRNLVYVADKFAPLMKQLGYETSKIVSNN